MEKKFIIEFLPYELALKMKQLGFNEPCFGLWNLNNGKYEVDIIGVCKYSKEFKYREVLAPLYQQCFLWFREKYKLVAYIEYYAEWNFEIFRIDDKIAEVQDDVNVDYTFRGGSYEEAELECLKKLIELCKKN